MSEIDRNNDIITYNSSNTPYNNNQIAPVHNRPDLEDIGSGQNDFVPKMINKWPLVMGIFIILAILIVPLVWLFAPTSNKAQILIEVLPVTPIVLSDPDNSATTHAYGSFKNSQAQIMLGERMLQRTADILRDKQLYLFTPAQEGIKAKLQQVWQNKDISFLTRKEINRYDILSEMVKNGKISAISDRNSDFIFLSVETAKANDATVIAEAIRQSYKEVELSQMDEEGDKKIITLEEELKQITRDLERQQENIFQLTVKYGYADLTKRHDMIIDRMQGVQDQLTTALSEKSKLEATVSKLETTIDAPVELPKTSELSLSEQQSQYIKNDERLNSLTQSLIEEEKRILYLQQSLKGDNPEIERQQKIIDSLSEKAETRRSELKEEFTQLTESEKDMQKKEILATRQTELDETKAIFEEQVKYIELLQEQLKEDNDEAIEIGRLDTLIKRKQEEAAQQESIKRSIQDKILKLKIESKRPGRINADMPVSVTMMPSKKMKLVGGAVFACLAVGLGLAFVQVKMDNSILYPEDIIRQAGLAIVGTTVDPSSVKKKEVSQYITMDYQNIRANLKLLNDGIIPQTLCITSAEPGEGKTTLSINLAASLARSNHRVLLIDGDLRKPDIHKIIRLSERTVGLREVASGICIFEDAVFEDYHPNLDILRACGSTNFDTIQLLSGYGLVEFLERMKGKYDHIIIDTSPIMSAPDALLWARLTDAVVLSSLSGKTNSKSLKTTVNRLAKLNVKILGNVLSSVKNKPGYGYGQNYYDYTYGMNNKKTKKRKNSDHLIVRSDNFEI